MICSFPHVCTFSEVAPGLRTRLPPLNTPEKDEVKGLNRLFPQTVMVPLALPIAAPGGLTLLTVGAEVSRVSPVTPTKMPWFSSSISLPPSGSGADHS